MKSVPLFKVATIVTGIQDYFRGHRGPIRSIILAPSCNNCIPVLLVHLTGFTGLRSFRSNAAWTKSLAVGSMGICFSLCAGGRLRSTSRVERPFKGSSQQLPLPILPFYSLLWAEIFWELRGYCCEQYIIYGAFFGFLWIRFLGNLWRCWVTTRVDQLISPPRLIMGEATSGKWMPSELRAVQR